MDELFVRTGPNWLICNQWGVIAITVSPGAVVIAKEISDLV